MLRHAADRRSLAFVAAFYVLVAVRWFTHPGTLVAVVLLVLTCVSAFLVSAITHNAIHSPVFRVPWHNAVFQVVLTLGYGHPVSMFVPGHTRSHHRHLQTARDAMRTTKARFRWHLLNVLLLPAIVGGAVFRGNVRYARVMARRNPRWFRQFLLEAAIYLVVCGTLAWLDPWLFLTTLVLPHQYAAWGVMAMNLVQHDGCDPASTWNHSRNFVGRSVNWWTFNNGYHAIHHLHPGLHWSLLPEAHRREVSPNVHPGLEQADYPAWLVRTFLLPGGRRRYDGTPLRLPPSEPDADWLGHPRFDWQPTRETARR
jgi:fatty acid desaturase